MMTPRIPASAAADRASCWFATGATFPSGPGANPASPPPAGRPGPPSARTAPVEPGMSLFRDTSAIVSDTTPIPPGRIHRVFPILKVDFIENIAQHGNPTDHGRGSTVPVLTSTTAPRQGSPPASAAGAGSLPVPGATATPRAAQAVGRRGRRRGWLRLISPLALLALWQIVSTTGVVSQQKLPSLSTLWTTAVHLITTSSPTYGTLQGAMAISLGRVAIGFAIGGAAGVSRFGETSVDPIMQALRTLPLFGLIPVFIVWFGIGELPKVTLIALGAAIPLYLNTFAGIRGVDGKLAELGQVLA